MHSLLHTNKYNSIELKKIDLLINITNNLNNIYLLVQIIFCKYCFNY